MKKFIASLVLVSILGFLSPSALAQSDATPNAKKTIKMQLYFMGYLTLPEGYRAFKTESWIDAWFGYIISPDEKFRINYSAGLVQTPFEDGNKGYLWVKRETRGKVVLRYGLRRTESGDEIAATVQGMNFYASVKNVGDIDLFLEIVRSYVVGKCSDCDHPTPPIQQVLGADSPLASPIYRDCVGAAEARR